MFAPEVCLYFQKHDRDVKQSLSIGHWRTVCSAPPPTDYWSLRYFLFMTLFMSVCPLYAVPTLSAASRCTRNAFFHTTLWRNGRSRAVIKERSDISMSIFNISVNRLHRKEQRVFSSQFLSFKNQKDLLNLFLRGCNYRRIQLPWLRIKIRLVQCIFRPSEGAAKRMEVQSLDTNLDVRYFLLYSFKRLQLTYFPWKSN